MLEDKTFNVIAMPFMKFFNAAEPLGKATTFDWATAGVRETRRLADDALLAQGPLDRGVVAAARSERQFKSAFWDAWKARGYALPGGVIDATCSS